MNAFPFRIVLIAVVTMCFLIKSIEAFPWDSKPQEGIQWGNDLNQAYAIAGQTGKPILIHFFSDSCPPCRMMEKSTFPNPAIVGLVQSSFIPIKFNTNQNPVIAQQFRINAVPTDIILMPDGHGLNMAQGGQDVQRYQQFLTISLRKYQQFLETHKPVPPPQPSVGSMGSCPIDQTPSFDYSKIPDNEKAILEFEGYCPVELGQKMSWVRGDYNIREVFDGRMYFFAGQAQKAEFDSHPEKYAPAFQGADIVAWKENHKRVQGTRYYGAWAIGRVFLFSSEENLRKFEQNARYYLSR